MKREFKTLWIAVAVLAVLQLIGGTIYTAATAARERDFTYVKCTVVDVRVTEQEDTVTIEAITVTYTDADGNTVTAQMADFPASFSVGSTFEGRYTDDPHRISAEDTDWFTPVFLLILGGVYAIGDIVAFALRKKLGLYAMVDVKDEKPLPEAEDTVNDRNDSDSIKL